MRRVPALFVLACAACHEAGVLQPDSTTDGGLPGVADARAEDAQPSFDASVRDAEITRDAEAALDAAPLLDGAPAPDAEPRVVEVMNPVIAGDHPDPSVLRVVEADGSATYYLTHTVHNGGDFPAYRSRDLVTWDRLASGLLDRTSNNGSSIEIHGWHYCSRWAPQVVQLGPSSFMLSFTATRFRTAQSSCPGYREDSGVYLAWSSSPAGPFADAQHPWEALPAGGHITMCPSDVRNDIPHSLEVASVGCQGNYCHKIIRLDSDVFRDPLTGRWWMSYAWYTNRPPLVAWEYTNHGEHVNLVELDPADPFTVICRTDVAQIGVANPHDLATLDRLRSSCPRCGEMLSFTRGRQGEEVSFDGYSWGVTEGSSMFRRGEWVYLLVSGSLWDSPYYHVYWTAARSVEELAYDNSNRVVGRYLIPSGDQAFGHGSAVLGPDGVSWYYLHHRLDSAACRTRGDCARDVWLSPIDFEDRGDGLGDVYIRPRFPAETPLTSVRVF
jgi:beta-xylosidase